MCKYPITSEHALTGQIGKNGQKGLSLVGNMLSQKRNSNPFPRLPVEGSITAVLELKWDRDRKLNAAALLEAGQVIYSINCRNKKIKVFICKLGERMVCASLLKIIHLS